MRGGIEKLQRAHAFLFLFITEVLLKPVLFGTQPWVPLHSSLYIVKLGEQFSPNLLVMSLVKKSVSGIRNPGSLLLFRLIWWTVCVSTLKLLLMELISYLCYFTGNSWYILEVSIHWPGDFKIHKNLSEDHEQSSSFTVRDTCFLLWQILMKAKIPLLTIAGGKKKEKKKKLNSCFLFLFPP